MARVKPCTCLRCGGLCIPHYRGWCSWCWFLSVKGCATWAEYQKKGLDKESLL